MKACVQQGVLGSAPESTWHDTQITLKVCRRARAFCMFSVLLSRQGFWIWLLLQELSCWTLLLEPITLWKFMLHP